MIIMKPTKRSLSKYPIALEICRIAGVSPLIPRYRASENLK